jgi:hypothetical protein
MNRIEEKRKINKFLMQMSKKRKCELAKKAENFNS